MYAYFKPVVKKKVIGLLPNKKNNHENYLKIPNNKNYDENSCSHIFFIELFYDAILVIDGVFTFTISTQVQSYNFDAYFKPGVKNILYLNYSNFLRTIFEVLCSSKRISQAQSH